MLFNSYNFFLFLFLALIFFNYFKFFYRNNEVILNILLFSFSLIFYSWWSVSFSLILVANIIINYYFGKWVSMHKSKKLLTIGILFNLFFLGYYKYKNFFLENLSIIAKNNFLIEELILPLGISFFTFKHIYFLLENRKANITKHYSLLNYLTYITFFPHLIAGPLSKPTEILPQLKNFSNKKNFENLSVGLIIFFIGLFKKSVLADTFAIYTVDIFSISGNSYAISFFESWIAIISYTFQIYFDFSGYTDMATGIAKMFGIRFPINFLSPYKASSIIDFWKRWHISLSRFLKETIYIPLGGNQKGKLNSYIFILVTMLAGGFWHGASWNFVIWGFFHGLLIILNHFIRNTFIGNYASKFIFLKTLFVFFLINISWVFFNVNTIDLGLNFLRGAFLFNGIFLPENLAIYFENGFLKNIIEYKNIFYYGKSQIIMIIIGILIVFLLPNTFEVMEKFNPVLDVKKIKIKFKDSFFSKYFKFKYSIYNGVFYALLTLLGILSISDSAKEFIYYQF